MAKESENSMEMRPPNATKIITPTTIDRAETASLLVRSHSATEIDGARRNRGQQTQVYDVHKGIAESAMDISLLTANANQLRLLITYNNRSKTYIACITLVIISLVLQVLVASGVIIIRSQPKSKRSVRMERLKIATSIGVSIITVINILVASLVVTDGSSSSSVP
ncbi:ninjurin-B-like isoform X3 [Toxorhynchites rutilus septentrionalis]|nr:ninjurin-B-like isoform X3 [Toxorhynchites rutilus septentrionalis]XP_055638757.1 ninjurin-B-like isoform X3 [Toxorhynchites rutilus septentrionalis]